MAGIAGAGRDLLLLALIAAPWAFRRIDRRAGLLLVPYLLWSAMPAC